MSLAGPDDLAGARDTKRGDNAKRKGARLSDRSLVEASPWRRGVYIRIRSS